MIIKKAEFVKSSLKITECPKPDKPEFAFWGRSNVGKSSLVNMLVDHKKLAKISEKPGKTQLINHFMINENWYLVDLPGYGYAKRSKSDRMNWDNEIRIYLKNRENLQCLFLLIDCRLEPQRIDLENIIWLGENKVPFALVFTKTDKVKSSLLNTNSNVFKNEMLKRWEKIPQIFQTSVFHKNGKEELLEFISGLI